LPEEGGIDGRRVRNGLKHEAIDLFAQDAQEVSAARGREDLDFFRRDRSEL
jgi:hypothetical protein